MQTIETEADRLTALLPGVRALMAQRFQVFKWSNADGSIRKAWNVSLALFCLADVEKRGRNTVNARITWEDADFLMGVNPSVAELNPATVDRADLSKPLLLATLFNPATAREEQILIDGWHRLARFHRDKRGTGESLPAVVLPADLSAMIELPPEVAP